MRGITAATLSVVFLLAGLPAAAVRAQLPPVVINAPPTVVSDNREFRSNETLNVSAGGVVGNSVTANGGTVNISGGTIGYRFASVTTTKTTITGGEFGRDFFGGGSSPGFTKISGGTFAREVTLQGSGTELIGGEFRMNGTPVSGSTNLPLNSVFTGVLKDGTVFILSPLVGDGIANVGTKLTTAALPAAPASPLTVSSNNGPRGLRAGKTLNLVTGGSLINNFAAVDAVLHISGGDAGDGLEVVGTQVNVTGGVVGGGFHAFTGSTIKISGGTITGAAPFGDGFETYAGSAVEASGGDFTGQVDVYAGSQWSISGGTFSNLDLKTGSSAKITGGQFSLFYAEDGSAVNVSAGKFTNQFLATGPNVAIEGGEFFLNGAAYAGSNVTLGPTDVLSGVFSDGTGFLFTPLSSDALNGVTLIQRAVPAAAPSPITVDSSSAPGSLREGQTLNLVAGGVLPNSFTGASGTLNVAGGTANGIKVHHTQVNVTSGNVNGIELFYSNMNVQGGSVSSLVANYSHVDIGPGSAVGNVTGRAGGTVAMTGGTLQDATLSGGGELTVTGGTVKSVTINANSAAHLSNAVVDGVDAEQFASLDVNNVTMKSLFTVNNSKIELTNATITSSATFSGKVNFYSGSLPNRTTARDLSFLDILGGTVGTNFTADFGSVVNIKGGQVGANFTTGLHSVVTITGGSVGNAFAANSLSTINIAGGSVGDGFNAFSGSKVNISGGSVGSAFNANNGATVNITRGTVGEGFNANAGSIVNISGGMVGAMFDAFTGSAVNLTGGSVGNKLNVPGGTFKIAGGSIGDDALVTCLSSTIRAKLTMSAGSIGNNFRVQGYFSQPNPNLTVIGPATVEISGGTVGNGFAAGVASIVNISGGVFGDGFVAEKGSAINLFGSGFLIDGLPIAGLALNVPYTVASRDVKLTGFFKDGSPFDFDLRSTGTVGDRFDPLATLTVTLAVPEPAGSVLILVAALASNAARKRHGGFRVAGSGR